MTTSNRTAAYTAGPPENSTTTGDANSKNGHRYCHLNCASHTRSCRRLQCCEPTSEERWCGKSARHVLWETGAGENGPAAQPVGPQQTKGGAKKMVPPPPPPPILTSRLPRR